MILRMSCLNEMLRYMWLKLFRHEVGVCPVNMLYAQLVQTRVSTEKKQAFRFFDRRACLESLRLALRLGLCCKALPAISSGSFGVPKRRELWTTKRKMTVTSHRVLKKIRVKAMTIVDKWEHRTSCIDLAKLKSVALSQIRDHCYEGTQDVSG